MNTQPPREENTMIRTPLTHNALRLVGASVLVSMLGYSAVNAQNAPDQGASAADQDQAAKAPVQNPLAGKSMESRGKAPGSSRSQEMSSKTPAAGKSMESSKKGPGADKNQEQASKNPLPNKSGQDQKVQFQPGLAEAKRQLAIAHIAARDHG